METVGRKRASRFDDSEHDPAPKKPAVDVTAAAARAAELSKLLATQIAQVSTQVSSVISANLAKANKLQLDRKAQYRPLLLDAAGRAIDENGNLIKSDSQFKTIAANLAVDKDMKKKVNPYLAHRAPTIVAAVTATASPANDSAEILAVDERLPKAGRRDLHAKKSLHFIDPGTYVKEADKARLKEERKLIAGYSSGRKALEHKDDEQVEGGDEGEVELSSATAQPTSNLLSVPPPVDLVVPSMEWWDEAFLPKELRDNRRISRVAADKDDFAQLSWTHNKTHKYVQHPVPVKPLGAINSGQTIALPMFLTKKEQKKLRKTTRQEREREKRDKQMMGLIPAPEPKFKLSNFMKVLGDQAVADPSKVELRVLQQMQQRVLNHEMRNQAAKLTPKERKDKKIKKLHEDTSRSVSVAVFRVRDFSNLKHRFKVDVNAQQHFMSGTVLLCGEPEGHNLVVVEGGPKGVRKFIKLMTERIKWTEASRSADHFSSSGAAQEAHTSAESSYYGAPGMSVFADATTATATGADATATNENGANSDDDDDDDDDDDEDENYATVPSENGVDSTRDNSNNRCDLLWQGILPKRLFTGFKFQEAKNASACRRLLESKSLSHYWDMVEKADEHLGSSQLADQDLFQ